MPAETTVHGGDRESRGAFSVATYNVNWGNRDFVATAQIILDSQADLVCIQESTLEFERGLKRELNREYRTIMFRGDRATFPAERFGFMSKLPIRRERFVHAKHGIFGAWIIDVEIPIEGGVERPVPNTRDGAVGELASNVVQIANVHLEPIRPPAEGELLTMFKRFEETETIHSAEIAWLDEHLAKELPTVVAGDFNSLSFGGAPRYLRSKAYIDSFASVTDAPDTHPTWRWPTRWLNLSGRIDYIFHSPHFRTVESRINQHTKSDHALLVSRLEWATDLSK